MEKRQKAEEKEKKSVPLGEYIKFYCYDNIKHENRKFSLVTLSSFVSTRQEGENEKALRGRTEKN